MMSRFIQTKVLLIFSCMENALFSIKPIVFGWFLGDKNEPKTMGRPIKTKVEGLSIVSLTKCIVMKIQTVFAMDILTAAVEKIELFVCSFWQMAEHIPALKRKPQLILETASNTISPIVEIEMSIIRTMVVGISIASLPNYITSRIPASMISGVEHVSAGGDMKGIEQLVEKCNSLKKIPQQFTEASKVTSFDLMTNLSWTKLKAKTDPSFIKVTHLSSTKLKPEDDSSHLDAAELLTGSQSSRRYEKSSDSNNNEAHVIANNKKVARIELTTKLKTALIYGAILVATISFESLM
eukprot:GFUD01028529.1.p1 GENE.GFUD01028529.1~~GFUD01028529.1.p1  ORF type:complete len:295 (+),score=45.66 GFUD01028529.1:66-950(+)